MSVCVVGAGGHAKVIIALIEASGGRVGGVYDADVARVGSLILGHCVQALSELGASDDVVVAIGGNRVRQQVAAELFAYRFVSLVHPLAWVAPTAKILPGAVVFAGAVVQPDAVVGAHAIVNTGASVDHDCVLGEFVHLGPGSHLAGNVVVDDGAFLGVGVSVIPGKRIGRWAVVGAGAVVVDDIADDVIVKGVPAR